MFRDETLFTTIVELALSSDKENLIKLLEDNPFINVYNDHWTPVMLLAEMGKHQSVDLLLELGADIDDAVWAYAKKGNVNRVNQLIQKGGNPDWATEGYILGGHEISNEIASSFVQSISSFFSQNKNQKMENEFSDVKLRIKN